jgi:hypothetical protein
MKLNRDRQWHFGTFRSPTPDEPNYQEAMEFYAKRLADDPKLKKSIKKTKAQAFNIVHTQLKSGIGLLQDSELRFFYLEFNSRVWNHGFGALPSSFNVLEGFFKWRSKLFFFELFDEEEYLFSFFDFVDFITSKKCSESIVYFIEHVKDELIYSYNILNEVKEITFRTTDSKEYVIGGVSFVKRENEVFMLIIAGELVDTEEISKDLPGIGSATSSRSYIKPGKDRKSEAVRLFDKKDIWKVNIYLRIDLNSKTIDSRYIQKDVGDSFTTLTDDFIMLKSSIKDEMQLGELMKTQVQEIEKYDAIFEVAYKCLHLPEYFDFYDSEIVSEEHPTDLFNEKLRSTLLKNTINFNSNYFFKTKDVWVLDRDFVPKSGIFKVKQSELKIQKDGYWQKLGPGSAGKDKNGNTIHNRTWIEKTLSWYETTQSQEVEIKIPNITSVHSGYIYLLRNPSHELDLFKIGLTTKSVEERAKELSGTSSPDKFVIIHRWFVSDCVVAEKIIHQKLDIYRLNARREFFRIDLEKAIAVISPIIKELNKESVERQP